ncbi:MAG: hypothetical protein WAV38_24665 [Xanthobacteraceae bacterium]|jgi:hypothetical protein
MGYVVIAREAKQSRSWTTIASSPPLLAMTKAGRQKRDANRWRLIGLLPIAGEWAGTAKKTSLLAISPGGTGNLLIDKEN